MVADSFVSYQPGSDVTGTDTFTYRLVDANGNESDPATVTITLPGAGGDGSLKLSDDGTQGELPGDDYSFYINDTLPRTLDVLANDLGDGMTIVAVSKSVPDRRNCTDQLGWKVGYLYAAP
ncbi:MAG: hypothetical protein R3E95_20055 [Thiolinea sp.]